ncbi:hypothetical protein FHX42_002493 [Saccharopolyspora lacisalsi]|uniref:Uncharacterized protein n=1 Tax=Halosaccharopolyspora lacisalsi TaxID=1000566 RepID=A0A839DT35_9PSEU|nr:hypothetical protein [Halosaccharopolyspora lacisalsi]MBA8825142.1 hypothetical protein [Halosaccharopolyspora lacisalsi]
MTDPFLESIAAALAGQAAAGLGAAGLKALEKVRELVRRKSQDDPRTQAALEGAEDRPADHPKVEALAERLDQVTTADPDFDGRLRSEGAAIHRELNATEGGVVNENSGTVTGTLVQGQNFGDLTIN